MLPPRDKWPQFGSIHGKRIATSDAEDLDPDIRIAFEIVYRGKTYRPFKQGGSVDVKAGVIRC